MFRFPVVVGEKKAKLSKSFGNSSLFCKHKKQLLAEMLSKFMLQDSFELVIEILRWLLALFGALRLNDCFSLRKSDAAECEESYT